MVLDYIALGVGVAGLTIIIGVLLMQKADKTKISGVIPLMLLGMILGPITGLFDPTPYIPMISTVVTFILVVILFDVGYGISIADIKKEAGPAMLLGFGAALITALFAGVLAFFVFHTSWQLALLFTALVISTDLTIVDPLLSALKIKERHREILSLESAINSVIAAVIAVIAVNMLQLQAVGATGVLKTFLYNFFVGAAFGLMLGYLIVFAVKHLALDEKPHIISIGAVLLVYAVTNLVGASGIMAALLVGIVFRNSSQKLPKIIKSYSGDLEILLVVFVYVILGTLISFTMFRSLRTVFISLGFIALVLLARWISSWLFTKRYSEMSTKLVFFSGPRGTVTAVLALSYASYFGDFDVLGVIFLIILVTTILSSAIPFISSKPARAKVAAKK